MNGITDTDESNPAYQGRMREKLLASLRRKSTFHPAGYPNTDPGVKRDRYHSGRGPSPHVKGSNYRDAERALNDVEDASLPARVLRRVQTRLRDYLRQMRFPENEE